MAAGRSGHAPVAVGRAGGDAFEQREHAAHLGHRVERGHEVHLRRARIHEAGVDSARDQRADERLGAVHVCPPSSKMVPGLRMPCGSNAALIRRISSSFVGIFELGDVRLLLGADAVLAGDRAAERHARGEDVVDQSFRADGVLLEHREVDVAVAGVAATHDHAPCASPRSATAAMNSGIDARGTTMSRMSSAPAAFAIQNAFSRASINLAPAVDGST